MLGKFAFSCDSRALKTDTIPVRTLQGSFDCYRIDVEQEPMVQIPS